jgi:hypothetical protein
MPPRNPSELQRLTEELEESKYVLRTQYLPKSTKEFLLREIRRLEGVLGIEGIPYNES